MHPESIFWRAIAVGAVVSALLMPSAVAARGAGTPEAPARDAVAAWTVQTTPTVSTVPVDPAGGAARGAR